MKLAAIYNVWDGEELLPASMQSVAEGVDLFIIIYQTESNYGEYHNPLDKLGVQDYILSQSCVIEKYDPIVNRGGMFNEKRKRNLGLEIAKAYGVTHFLHYGS